MVDVRARRLPLVLLGALWFTCPASAAVLEVDGPDGAHFPTIQSAIDAAVPGVDEVFVHCGTYFETITMKDRVAVRGKNPLCAVIDAQQMGPVVTMPDLSSATVFERFTVRQAAASADAAIIVERGFPVITQTVIRDNPTRGIAVLGTYGQFALTAPTITHNIITDNAASEGSALYVTWGQGIRISNNLIVSNSGAAGGGAVFGLGIYAAVISNNTIAGNGTVGLRLEYGDADIANNLFFDNTGGDYSIYYSYPVFRRNSGAVPNSVGGPPDLADERVAFNGFVPRSDSVLIDAGADDVALSRDLQGIERPHWVGSPDSFPPLEPAPASDIGAQEAGGMTGFQFTSKDDFEWDGCHPNACTIYRVWRGDLQVLRDGGAYTQDPDSVPGAMLLACGSWFPFLSDSDLPIAGQVYFYLVHAVDEPDSDAAGGSLGVDSALESRLISRNCYTGF